MPISLQPSFPLPMARFLLVGVGPHAKRTYIQHLKTLKNEGKAELVAAVDVIPNYEKTVEYQKRVFPGPELVFVPPFTDPMPDGVSNQLNEVAQRLQVECVIISTEPQCHKSYGLWAISQGLNVIMDKPITTRKHVVTDCEQAAGIADDFDELLQAYEQLQMRKTTFFLVNSHRRYHPGFYCTYDMIADIQKKTGCPVTNITSTHCDGMWRLPSEIVDQTYHPFLDGYGKVSHSGYHFLDCVYRFMKAGWNAKKRPDQIEVVSAFLMPTGVIKTFNHEDHQHTFGTEEYDGVCRYSDEELAKLMTSMGEIDAMLQVSFKQKGETIAIAHINLQHTGFSRRSWLTNGEDLYKGCGRVKHEAHEIRSGAFQTVVIESRQANDKHDRSKPSTAELGTDNHFEVQTWRNCDLLKEKEPLHVYTVDELDSRYDTQLPGIYSENVKRGILWEAVDFLRGGKKLEDLASNLPDHSIPAVLMGAVYISHVKRMNGQNPVTSLDLSYASSSDGALAKAKIRPEEDHDGMSDSKVVHNFAAVKEHVHEGETPVNQDVVA